MVGDTSLPALTLALVDALLATQGVRRVLPTRNFERRGEAPLGARGTDPRVVTDASSMFAYTDATRGACRYGGCAPVRVSRRFPAKLSRVRLRSPSDRLPWPESRATASRRPGTMAAPPENGAFFVLSAPVSTGFSILSYV